MPINRFDELVPAGRGFANLLVSFREVNPITKQGLVSSDAYT